MGAIHHDVNLDISWMTQCREQMRPGDGTMEVHMMGGNRIVHISPLLTVFASSTMIRPKSVPKRAEERGDSYAVQRRCRKQWRHGPRSRGVISVEGSSGNCTRISLCNTGEAASSASCRWRVQTKTALGEVRVLLSSIHLSS